MGYTEVTKGLHFNNDTDLAKAFTMLDGLKPGEILDLNRLAENRREVFRNCAKQYADIYGTICFNDNYTKIKKLHNWK